jgi:hypothetical protein
MRGAVRCQSVGPTIPDNPDAVMRDDDDQASVAVLSMLFSYSPAKAVAQLKSK